MTPNTLRRELVRSLKRRGLDAPPEPYKRKKPLYVRDDEDYVLQPIASRPRRSDRTTRCDGCGKKMKTRKAKGQPVQCHPCRRAENEARILAE